MKASIVGVFVCSLTLSGCAYIEGLHDNSPPATVQSQSLSSTVQTLKQRQTQKQNATNSAAKLTSPLTQ